MLRVNYLSQIFNNKSKDPNIFRVSRGAQMSNFGGPYMWLLFLLILLIIVVAFIGKDWPIALILIVINFFLFFFIVDVRGFEIDLKNKKIRSYKSFIGYRYGEWYDLDTFEGITIKKDKVLERKKIYSRKVKFDVHHFYFIHLIQKSGNKSIILGERNNFSNAEVFALNISKSTGFKLL